MMEPQPSIDFSEHPPRIARGLPVSQISFSGGRTAASIARHGGITHIDYYGTQRLSDVGMYRADPISAWTQLFRPVAIIGGKTHLLEFSDTKIFPFGYCSGARVADVELRHGFWLLNDAIVFTLDVKANPAGIPVSFSLIHADACVCVRKATRGWEPFANAGDGTVAVAAARDRYSEEFLAAERERGHPTLAQRGTKFLQETGLADTFIGVVADGAMTMRETPPVFRKFYFRTDVTNGRATFSLVFASERDAVLRRASELRRSARDEVSALRARHDRQLASQGSVRIGRPVLESFLANAAGIMDSLKVKDLPGGMRAADSGYWIWSWDNLVYSDALGWAKDVDFMKQALEFHRRTSDPEMGLAHAMSLDHRNIKSMKFPTQCLYAILLYQAYAFTGDRAMLVEYLPFARWIADAAGKAELGESGLLKGVSPYPDHPEDLGQTGDDLCSFNNSIYYQALRALAGLCKEAGETSAAADYDARAARTRTGFARFFDTEKHFFLDSLSAADFSPRRHYPIYAILWLTPFAADLVAGREQELARFARENFPALHGVRILPSWDDAFMYDGNQLGMYMPVIENLHRQLMKIDRDADGVKRALEDIEWFWKELCIPEALTCEYENHGVTMDNPGRKQLFCLKAWLSQFYRGAVGVECGLHGLSFSPADIGDVEIAGIRIRGHGIRLRVSGRGWRVARLLLNGRDRGAEAFVSYEELRDENEIEIVRG